MLGMRASDIAEGGGPFGWQAFGSPAAIATLQTDAPLVGYLTHDRLLPSAATVSVAGWITAMLEAEVAAHLSRDVNPACSSSEALAAVRGWSAAGMGGRARRGQRRGGLSPRDLRPRHQFTATYFDSR